MKATKKELLWSLVVVLALAFTAFGQVATPKPVTKAPQINSTPRPVTEAASPHLDKPQTAEQKTAEVKTPELKPETALKITRLQLEISQRGGRMQDLAAQFERLKQEQAVTFNKLNAAIGDAVKEAGAGQEWVIDSGTLTFKKKDAPKQ